MHKIEKLFVYIILCYRGRSEYWTMNMNICKHVTRNVTRLNCHPTYSVLPYKHSMPWYGSNFILLKLNALKLQRRNLPKFSTLNKCIINAKVPWISTMKILFLYKTPFAIIEVDKLLVDCLGSQYAIQWILEEESKYELLFPAEGS